MGRGWEGHGAFAELGLPGQGNGVEAFAKESTLQLKPTSAPCPVAVNSTGVAISRPDGYPRVHHSGHEARMADSNLEALSLKELRQLLKDLAKAISTYEDRHKAEARAKLEAIAKEMGYSLADLIGTEVKPTRAPAAAKYRHPENPSLTWSCRGRKPLWFVAALETDKSADDLAIG
jgi:DNA-binding protein H-NS